MKKSILAVCLGLAGFWSVLAEDSPIAAPGRVNEQGDAELPSGELLSDHVAEAEFTGMIHRKCRFLTSLCPDKCDHARDFAVFRIVKYLDYRKPGKYGDEKQEQLMVDVNPAHKPILQSADILKKISALKPGGQGGSSLGSLLYAPEFQFFPGTSRDFRGAGGSFRRKNGKVRTGLSSGRSSGAGRNGKPCVRKRTGK